MAVKTKNQVQKSKLVEILMKEYKWENLVLGIAAMGAMMLGILILSKTLTIDPSFPVLGEAIAGTIFAWVIIVIALFGLTLLLYPFISPAIPELKKISWPKWKVFLTNAARVLIFTALLTALLFGFDTLINGIFSKIEVF